MHPKRREPIDIRRTILLSHTFHDPRYNLVDRYRFNILFQVLEADPASAWKRREQQQAIAPTNHARLVPRKRRGHRDIGNQEMPAVSRAFERLAHRVSRNTMSATRTNENFRSHRLHAAIGM